MVLIGYVLYLLCVRLRVCVCGANLFCVKSVRCCDLIVFHMCCVISVFILSSFDFVCVSVVGEPPRFSFPFFIFRFPAASCLPLDLYTSVV
jgi:hypothetical protein